MSQRTACSGAARALGRACVAVGFGMSALLPGSGLAAPVSWSDDLRGGLAAWGPLRSSWGEHNREFRTEGTPPLPFMRVHIRKGSIDPASMVRRGQPRAGTGFKAGLLPPGTQAAELRYWVRFPSDFNFVRGGKLPGLYGGAGNSGGHIPTGSDGFSFRLMWLAGGRGQVYAYLPTSRQYGTSLLKGDFRFERGRWHRLRQQITLNTPGLDDGKVALWIDDRLAGEIDRLRIRDVPRLTLDGIFFDVFFGGNDDTWAAAADTHVDFAHFDVAPLPGSGR